MPEFSATQDEMCLINMHPAHNQDDSDRRAIQFLCEADPTLRLVHVRLGDPPSLRRKPGFDTLARIVLEQQVSLKSAQATHAKLARATQPRESKVLTPRGFAQLSPDQTRRCGVSRQKDRYLRQLCDDILKHRFDLDGLVDVDNATARQALTARLGIGHWTADVYLMMALGRPDILPAADLGLIHGLAELDGGTYPDFRAIVCRAEIWRPYRSMATKLVWMLYLDNRGRRFDDLT